MWRLDIVVVGLNHRTASVELREQVSVDAPQLAAALDEFGKTRTLLECVIVSTCNRTEVYSVAASPRAAADYLVRWFARRSGMGVEQVRVSLYTYEGPRAVEHLFRVACGLDSMVMGETQILGQVRDAWLTAQERGTAGTLLNRVFHLAVETAKRAHTETDIGQHAVSVSYAAVQLAKKVFDGLERHPVLVIGAGETGRLAAQHLVAQGVRELWVVNRTWARAEALAQELGGRAVAWDALNEVLERADIVISATGAPGVVLTADRLRAAHEARAGRPQLVIDIAVPRDVAPAARNLPGIYLFDIDDLQDVVQANLAERERAARTVERFIHEAVQTFARWLAEQRVVPLIAALRHKGIQIQQSVMASLERKLPGLSQRERELLAKHTMSIVNQLLRDPVQYLKEHASTDAVDLTTFVRLFGLPEDTLEQGLTAASTVAGLGTWEAWLRQEAPTAPPERQRVASRSEPELGFAGG